MISIQRILFPTDFSEFSRTAEKYACAFVDQFRAEMHLLHVLHDAPLLLPEPGAVMTMRIDYIAEIKTSAERAMKDLLDPEWSREKTIHQVFRTGNPFVEIVRYAKEADIDLIVIGTHGRSGLAHVLLGSTAEKVVRKAPCPVLAVRPSGHQFVMP